MVASPRWVFCKESFVTTVENTSTGISRNIHFQIWTLQRLTSSVRPIPQVWQFPNWALSWRADGSMITMERSRRDKSSEPSRQCGKMVQQHKTKSRTRSTYGNSALRKNWRRPWSIHLCSAQNWPYTKGCFPLSGQLMSNKSQSCGIQKNVKYIHSFCHRLLPKG